MITFKKANELGLHGEPTRLCVGMVGGKRQDIESFKCKFDLVDKNNHTVQFVVYGMEQISTKVIDINLNRIKSMFPNARPASFRRPCGEIDILIGFEYVGFHPASIQSAKNQFGQCIGGSRPALRETTTKLIQRVTINHIKGINVDDFYNVESLGVQCNPQCGNCRCGKCPIGGKNSPLKKRESKS